MRILGLDYGEKTIGVAISDPFGWTAQGLEIIRKPDDLSYKKAIERLLALVTEYDVTTIVLGLPKNLDNSESVRSTKTRAFASRIQEKMPAVSLVLWDERFSTTAAQRTFQEAGVSRKKQKNVIDKMAAVHILQGYLDRAGK